MFRQNRPPRKRSPGTLSLADLLLATMLFSVGAVVLRWTFDATFESTCATTWIVLAFLYWRSRMIATLLIHVTGIIVAAVFFALSLLKFSDEGASVIYYAIEPTLIVGVPLAGCVSLAYGALTLSNGRSAFL